MLKQISLAAALVATVVTGSAAVAYADADAGIHDATRAITTSAALQRDEHAGAWASYGYASEPMLLHSSKSKPTTRG